MPREEDVATRDPASGELVAGMLVLLVLEEPADERLARVHLLLVGVVVFLAGRRRRQQHLRLDVRERRGHHEVLRRHVELHQLHDREVLEVFSVTNAMGMSRMSSSCFWQRCSSRSSGPSN